jgi:hypothetical protein
MLATEERRIGGWRHKGRSKSANDRSARKPGEGVTNERGTTKNYIRSGKTNRTKSSRSDVISHARCVYWAAVGLTCKVTTALGFFSTAYTRTRRCVSCAAARLARTSGPRPAPTTMIT